MYYLLTDSCFISTKIHVYNGFFSKRCTLYFNEFSPSVSNFFAPVTNFSYLDLIKLKKINIDLKFRKKNKKTK